MPQHLCFLDLHFFFFHYRFRRILLFSFLHGTLVVMLMDGMAAFTLRVFFLGKQVDIGLSTFDYLFIFMNKKAWTSEFCFLDIH